jgi:hypothetical protein
MNKKYIWTILLMAAGCFPSLKAQLNLTVGINQPPALVANPGTDVTICEGDTAQIGGVPTGGTPGYSFLWSPSSGLGNPIGQDPLAAPTITTTYSQVVTDAVGCTAAGTVTVTVNALPSASFSVVSTGLTASFTDLSSPTPTAWTWDYGDGDFGTSQNPTHTYTNPGTYVACVTVTSADGCVDTYCDSVVVVLVGMENPLAAHHLQAFPNPFGQQTRIGFELSKSEEVQVSVFDLSGKAIWMGEASSLAAGSHHLDLGAAQLGNATGVFLVKVQIGNQVYPIRLVRVN